MLINGELLPEEDLEEDAFEDVSDSMLQKLDY